MTKKEIKKLANFLVKKTKGQFHYEEDYWKNYFSKSKAKELSKKLSICMKDKNYQYFCDCLFSAFDNLFKIKERIK